MAKQNCKIELLEVLAVKIAKAPSVAGGYGEQAAKWIMAGVALLSDIT